MKFKLMCTACHGFETAQALGEIVIYSSVVANALPADQRKSMDTVQLSSKDALLIVDVQNDFLPSRAFRRSMAALALVDRMLLAPWKK